MINRRQPVEFGINMNLLGMIITQQQDLDAVAKLNYFTDSDPCHIYLIGKRPRVIVDPQSFKFYENYFTLTFKIQYGYSFKEINLDCLHFYTNEEVEFVSEFPYNFFMLVGKKTGAKLGGRAALLFQQANKQSDFDTDFLDLEILYVGQSYGEDGKRTPVDRLKSHSTLQNIYLEASNRNIDSEIWLTLVSFEEILIMASHHDNGYTEDESLEFWNNTGAKSFDKIYRINRIKLCRHC